MNNDSKIKRVLAIIACSIAILCIISNLFYSVASATNKEDEYYARISIMLGKFKEQIADNINTYGQIDNRKFTDGRKYLLIEYSQDNKIYYHYFELYQNLAGTADEYIKNFVYENKILKCQISQYYLLKGEYEELVANNYNTNMETGWGRTMEYSNVTACYTNCLDFIQWSEDCTLSTSDFTNNMIEGGLPLQMNEIIFEHYYNKNTDESHKLYVTNNSEYDMYITLECVLPTISGDTVIYQYGENQLVSVAPFYYYYQLAYKNADVAAKWLSYFLYDNATAELTEDEIYQNLMSSSDKWHKADYYSSGTCTIAYQYGLGLTFSECMNRVDEITKLENIISESNYAIEDSSKNINQKNTYILLAANDTKEINVLKNQLTLTSGVKYEWVLKIGSAADKMGEHSRKGFTAISSSVGKEEIDNNVYDENGNIIGSYDGDNNIIVDEEINSDIDVSPDINTSSVKGFIQSVSEVIKMFWGILPPAVMSVIVFGLSIVLAVGVIRLVTG